MAAKKPATKSTKTASSKLEARVKKLETQVKALEESQIRIPADFSETKNKLVVWAQENTLAALVTAIVVGLIVGLIFS